MAYMDENMIGYKYAQIGNTIKKIRESQGKSQLEVYIDTGISTSQISRIERGEVRKLLVKDLLLIAGALEVSAGEIIEGEAWDTLFDKDYKEKEREHLDRVMKFAKEEFKIIIKR